ncbi:MAG TPA: alkaline phosphatase [Actinobacteria bacterium]|nr:alkaline phosphatase [Actinomycetota bacterium]
MYVAFTSGYPGDYVNLDRFQLQKAGQARPDLVNVTPTPPSTPTPTRTVPAVPDQPGDAVIAAAGDIACPVGTPSLGSGSGSGASCRQWWVSESILGNWSRITQVVPLGDIQYNEGAYADFVGSYDKSWGRLNAKVAPVLGNHEASGEGYFDYFNGIGKNTGVAGTRGDGWYSYNTGDTANSGWHVVALNSECVGKECGTRQMEWLRTDLAANTKGCTIAYLHKPRFSIGDHGDDNGMQPFWEVLNQYGAEVLLAGHDHNYERQVPRNASGAADPTRGMRQFVVGTGGKGLRGVSPNAFTQANSKDTFGYLEMTLRANSYDWRFVRAESPGNGTFTDSGSTTCHR